MTRKTRLIPAALAATALLAVPSIGHAKTFTFGTRLDHEPSNSAPAHNCKEDGSEDATPTCTRVAIDRSDAVPGGLRAPQTGTIIRFRVRAGAPGTLTLRLAKLKNLGFNAGLNEFTGLGKGDGTGPTVNVQGLGFDENEANAIESFPAHLKVTKGDYLGVDSTSSSIQYCASGGAKQLIFSPKLGKSFRQNTTHGGCDLLVQAVMKPAPKKPKHH